MKTTLSLFCILGSLLWLQGCSTPPASPVAAEKTAQANAYRANRAEVHAADTGVAANATMSPRDSATTDDIKRQLQSIQQNESEERRRMMKQMATSYDADKKEAPMASGSPLAEGKA